MSSTFSNLKIELIATGEQLGTWGATTNTNLGTALEEAITGTADVTFASADITLTWTNTNASQTARNLRLNLGGTSGGARNLIVPAIEKFYIINNGCADVVTIKNATGTGISIGPGLTGFVFNNGTNVVDVINGASSMTLSTPMGVGSGGTGSGTAAGARTNILPSYSGNTGKVLTVNSGGTDVEWTTAAAGTGTVTSVGITSSDLTVGSSPVTTSGSITLALNTVPVAKGGTGSTSAGAARTALGVAIGTDIPSVSGTGATGTWGISISGNAGYATSAGSATSATAATSLATSNFSIVESGGLLVFRYQGSTIATLNSSGTFTAYGDVAAYGP
jgi:hypothetical protein